MTIINELAQQVAELRTEVGNRTNHLAALRAEWEAEHQPLIDELAEARDGLGAAETELRRIVEEVHCETGEKSFPLGIKVRTVTKVAFDAGMAREYAIANRQDLLTLDKRGFEKLIRAGKDGLEDYEWVQVAAVPQATLPVNMTGSDEVSS